MNDTQSKTAGSEVEREAFKTAYEHLDLHETPDAWGKPMFFHSHVEALWEGWNRRATLSHPKAVDEDEAQPFYDLAWKIGARRYVSFAGDELESLSFAPREFEAFCTALAATQPNAAPAAEVVARYHFTDGTCTLKQDVLDAIQVYAGSRPEEDAEEPESWESWFEAAFDLCSARVHDIFDEHARRDASRKQEVNHG